MHDAISVEELGIPAVGIITERFAQTARVMAESLGLADYPLARVPHPISNNTELKIRAKAEDVARQAVAILQSPVRAR